MRHFAVFFLCCLAAPALLARTLTTPSFVVKINSNCEEGNVTCDDVSYIGVSRENGSTITLKGKTIHTRCKDGSPCRFLGYEFRSGKRTYRVLEEGRLTVRQGDKMLVDEKGAWEH